MPMPPIRYDYDLLGRASRSRISRYVLSHGGTLADVDDVCQDALVVFLEQQKRPEFVLTVPPEAYVFSVGRNLWRDHMRGTGRRQALENDLPDLAEEDNTTELERVHVWLGRITIHCQRLLRMLFFQGQKTDAVQPEFHYRNRNTAYNQRYKCLQQLKQTAQVNPGTTDGVA